MALQFGIQALTFNDGSHLELEQNAVVVVVGPNNSGKSSLLREIQGGLSQTPPKYVVLRDVRARKEGTWEELQAWMKPHRTSATMSSNPDQFIKLGQGGWADETVRNLWANEPAFKQLSGWFVHHANTDSRLSVANRTGLHDRVQSAPSNPIQLLYEDRSAEQRIAAVFWEAFRHHLFLDRTSGSVLPLRVGDKPVPTNADDQFSRDYLLKVSSIPLLDTQGDGMRSFVGALLHGLIADWFVVLIDEPEAFLHPPQATLLGRMLAEKKPLHRQIVLATHSSDVVRGVLESNDSAVTIVRLDRQGNTNQVKKLLPADVRRLWSDPLLRFSNVFDGLFHELVVICEADADCRFFKSMSDATSTERADTLFVPSFGKHRMHVVADSLHAVGVTTRVVADFDVLREEDICKRLFESLGGNWSDVAREWKIVSSAVNAKTPALSLNQIREKITSILDSGGPSLTREIAEKIRATVKAVDGWDQVKSSGLAGIPSGDATKNAVSLLSMLRKRGLHVIPVGELESFARSVGLHGPAFVSAVLAKDLVNDSELEEARQFVAELMRPQSQSSS